VVNDGDVDVDVGQARLPTVQARILVAVATLVVASVAGFARPGSGPYGLVVRYLVRPRLGPPPEFDPVAPFLLLRRLTSPAS
jgi:hypothetical protein